MHELEPGFFTLGSMPIPSYTLRITAEALFVFPFGIPEGCRYTLQVHESRLSCWLYLFLTCWVSAKSLTQSLWTLQKCWRIASPVQVGADGGRKFDVKDVSWSSEIRSDQRPLLHKAKSLAVCPFPTIGFSDAAIHALRAHRPSIFVLSFASTSARAERQARESFERSPQVTVARK
jgi:hypothetical protein